MSGTMIQLDEIVGEIPSQTIALLKGTLATAGFEKSFDAVEMVRAIREETSARIEDMTLEEELEWLATQKLEDPLLERLREKARPPGESNRPSVGG